MKKVNKVYRVLDENTNKYFRYVFDNERSVNTFFQSLNRKKNNPFQTYRVVVFVNGTAVPVNV